MSAHVDAGMWGWNQLPTQTHIHRMKWFKHPCFTTTKMRGKWEQEHPKTPPLKQDIHTTSSNQFTYWDLNLYQLLSLCQVTMSAPNSSVRVSLMSKYGSVEYHGKVWVFPKIGVSPKWMVYNGKHYWNGWFGGTTIFGNTHVALWRL